MLLLVLSAATVVTVRRLHWQRVKCLAQKSHVSALHNPEQSADFSVGLLLQAGDPSIKL